jgi:hypothetical protein
MRDRHTEGRLYKGHIETTMKYYVVSPEEFKREAIKRLDGGMDTYRDTSKERDTEETSQPLEDKSEPWRIRTSDPLIKIQDKELVHRCPPCKIGTGLFGQHYDLGLKFRQIDNGYGGFPLMEPCDLAGIHREGPSLFLYRGFVKVAVNDQIEMTARREGIHHVRFVDHNDLLRIQRHQVRLSMDLPSGHLAEEQPVAVIVSEDSCEPAAESVKYLEGKGRRKVACMDYM